MWWDVGRVGTCKLNFFLKGVSAVQVMRYPGNIGSGCLFSVISNKEEEENKRSTRRGI